MAQSVWITTNHAHTKTRDAFAVIHGCIGCCSWKWKRNSFGASSYTPLPSVWSPMSSLDACKLSRGTPTDTKVLRKAKRKVGPTSRRTGPQRGCGRRGGAGRAPALESWRRRRGGGCTAALRQTSVAAAHPTIGPGQSGWLNMLRGTAAFGSTPHACV